MDYQRLYDCIIQNRLNKPLSGYTERHHILPKCLGGNNSKTNLVRLSAREHYICHWLLCKIYPQGESYHKLMTAFMRMHCMGDHHNRYINSSVYQLYKQKYSILRKQRTSGKNNPMYGHCWVHHDGTQQSIRVPKTELDKYIKDGWTVGRVNYNKIQKITLHSPDDKVIQVPLDEIYLWLDKGYTITESTKRKHFVDVIKDNDIQSILKIHLPKYTEQGYMKYIPFNKYQSKSVSFPEYVDNNILNVISKCTSWHQVADFFKSSRSTVKKRYLLVTQQNSIPKGLFTEQRQIKKASKPHHIKQYTKICPVCGSTFITHRKNKRACSSICGYRLGGYNSNNKQL